MSPNIVLSAWLLVQVGAPLLSYLFSVISDLFFFPSEIELSLESEREIELSLS